MAKSNLNRKEPPQALDVERITPEIRRLVRKGRQFYDRDDMPGAAKYWVQAWNLAPKNVDLLITVSHVLARLGVRQKSLEVLEQALAINGAQPEILAVLGDMALEMQMYDTAEKIFRVYIEQKPHDPDGYNNLASAIGQLQRHSESIELLSNVIPVFPENAALWNTLGTHVAGRDGYEAAMPFYEESYRLNPDNYPLLNNLSLAYANMGEYPKSVELAEQALKVNPEGYLAHMGLGTSLLAQGELPRGWAEYEWRQHPRRPGAIHYTHKLPRWDGCDLSEKRLLISPEQGLGDEILFALSFPVIEKQAKQLYIGCDPRLVTLFQRSFPKARVSPYIDQFSDAYRYRSLPAIEGAAREDFAPADTFIEAGSLPKFLWPDVKSIPSYAQGHLTPDPERVEFWSRRLKALGPNLKVGMSWRSGMRNIERNKLYATIEQWAPILAVKGVDFVNLQYDECREERQIAKDKFGVTLHHWDDLDLRNNIDDSAALVKNLDLVIGPTSTPGTIALAVGVEVWWLIRYKPWWSFGQETAPFHPKASFMQATMAEKWEDLMPSVGDRLAKRAQGVK